MVNQVYFFFTALLDLARVRTQWLLEDNNVAASLMTVVLLLKLVILTLESLPKYRHATEKISATPLERSGMFGRALLAWLNPLLRAGYKKNLGVEDLYPLDENLGGALLTEKFEDSWSRGESHRYPYPSIRANIEAVNKSRKHCLSVAVISNFATEILIAWIPRAFHIALILAQPFLVHTTLDYITNHQSLPTSYGYGLIGAWGIVYTGIAVCLTPYG